MDGYSSWVVQQREGHYESLMSWKMKELMFHRSVPHLPSRDPISRGEAHDHEYRHFLSLVNQPSAGEESFVGWQEEVPLIVTIHQLVLLKVLFWSWWIAVTMTGTQISTPRNRNLSYIWFLGVIWAVHRQAVTKISLHGLAVTYGSCRNNPMKDYG